MPSFGNRCAIPSNDLTTAPTAGHTASGLRSNAAGCYVIHRSVHPSVWRQSMKPWVRRFLFSCLAWATLALPAPLAFAQATSGELTGRILDPNGAAVPGVTVTVRSDETGLLRTATTNQAGEYLFVLLPPG